MITVEQTRNNGMFFRFDPLSVTPLEAASILMLAEIAFGGQVREITRSRIAVCTDIMGCIDESVFSGPPEEMALLLNCLDIFFSARENERVCEAGISRALRMSGGNPGVLSLCPGLLAFGRLAHVAFLVGAGVTDPDEVRAALAASSSDLVAALELRQGTGTPLTEIL